MPEHVSILMWMGVAVPAALTAACVIQLVRIRRRSRHETAQWRAASALATVPAQPRTPSGLQPASGPRRESVALTPAEEDAFAGLVRRLNDGS
ncbi:hypothetical protein ABZ920_23425 [Streptomyces sp. NPDC046831]|uniref:hypothetical protein n=1 Tax=Streptomyces sp. NPDC046831 TaxID=3154805 RepID=UPI0033CC622D